MMIPKYLFIHPLLGGLAVMLIVVAYAFKAGGRKYQAQHYWAGWAAWVVMTIAVFLALWTISLVEPPVENLLFGIAQLSWHFYWGVLLWGGMTLQVAIGEFMRRNLDSPTGVNAVGVLKWISWHWRLSQFLLVAIFILAIFGTPITYILLGDYPAMQTLWVIAALLVWGGFGYTVWQVESTSLEPRIAPNIRRVVRQQIFQVRVFPDQKNVTVGRNENILRANLEAGIPHTHVCGGHARCSTCRILVLSGIDNFHPRNSEEAALASRLGFSERVRLACQSRVVGDVVVRRLVLDEMDIELVSQLEPGAQPTATGQEENVAVLFSDIQGFTRFAESQLPYDVIHALNRYFRVMGKIIDKYGGEIRNYSGDGLMAIFSEALMVDPCWQAVLAGEEMFEGLEQLREYFRQNYDYSIDMRVGIHYGSAVIGDIGADFQKQHTAIGDTVNYASRIEAANKDAGTRFLISKEVYDQVSSRVEIGQMYHFTPEGKTGNYTVYEISRIHDGQFQSVING